MESLQHDPRTKQQIKDMLYSFLYQPVKDQYDKKLQSIIKQNCSLLASGHDSFIYKGVVYAATESTKLPRKMNRLAPQLEPLMNEYLKEVKQLNEYELPYVLGFINQVLNSSNDLQDYLKVLPPSIHRPIEELIASCPCRTTKLTPDKVQEMQEKNQLPIELIKKRQVLNLLL